MPGLEKEEGVKRYQIDIKMVGEEFRNYEFSPEMYILEKVRIHNPWPSVSEAQVHGCLKMISSMYNPITYHNLTHGFDVMVNMDSFLTNYGWQQKLQISEQKRMFMLIAAYAHDAGHEGMTNQWYKNTKHQMAKPSPSPLQFLHISNLKKALREHQLEIDSRTMEELTQMILRTDNFYHGYMLKELAKLKGLSNEELRKPKNSLMTCCMLLHAADLNNTAKDKEVSLLWTHLLYEEFQFQRKMEVEQKLKITFDSISTLKGRAGSNLWFLDNLVLPLYVGLVAIQPKFDPLLKKINKNKEYWVSVK